MGKTRITEVCAFCKKRKIKCNREQPCSSCVRFGNLTCQYPDGITPVLASDTKIMQDLIARLDYLNRKLNNTASLEVPRPTNETIRDEDDQDDYENHQVLNVYEDYDPTANSTWMGALSFGAMYRIDPLLCNVWDTLLQDEVFLRLYRVNSTSLLKLNVHSKGNSRIRNEILLQKIVRFLPSNKEIWRSVEVFFNRVYVFFPVVDEFSFRPTLELLIGNDDDHLIKLHDDLSLIYFGQILFILRVSSLVDRRLEPILEKAIELAVECVNRYPVMRFNHLEYLLLMLMIQFYRIHAPEVYECYDQNCSGVLVSLMFQKASMLGLHRDPINLDKSSEDGRINNLRRKMWMSLVIVDAVTSGISGNPLNTSRFSFDTEAPYWNEINSNNMDPEIEKISVYLISMGKKVLLDNMSVLEFFTNYRQRMSLKTVIECLSPQLNYIVLDSPLYKELVNNKLDPNHYYMNTIRLRSFFLVLALTGPLKTKLLLKFLRDNRMDKFLTNCVQYYRFMYEQFLPMVHEVANELATPDCQKRLGVFWIMPSLQAAFNRVINVHIILYSKTSSKTRGIIQQGLDLFLGYLHRASTRSFYSWKALKMNTIIYENVKKRNLEYNTLEIPQIHPIIEEALSNHEFDKSFRTMNLHDEDSVWLRVLSLENSEWNFL